MLLQLVLWFRSRGLALPATVLGSGALTTADHRPPLMPQLFELCLAEAAPEPERLARLIQRLPDAKARQGLFDIFRASLTEARRQVLKPFDEGAQWGSDAAGQLATITDGLLKELFAAARSCNPDSKLDDIAIVAVGGYGRAAMAPFSDVDLLILVPGAVDEAQMEAINFILYFLWDLKFKVGHTVRTPAQTIEQCKADWTIRTAQADARLVVGSKPLFDELTARFDKLRRADAKDFIAAKLAERELRLKRAGYARYALEPDIKEGKGGFRDLQSLMWIAREAYGIDTIRDLQTKGVLDQRQRAILERGENFFWALRFHLHMAAGRAEEKLTFDRQQAIAERIGFRDDTGESERAVERFMRHYFLTAKNIGILSNWVLADLDERADRQPWLRRIWPFGGSKNEPESLDGFALVAGRVAVADQSAFDATPRDMIRIFLVAQRAKRGVQPATLRLLSQKLALIDDKLRQDSKANAWFLEILTAKSESPRRILTQMSETGVLGRFVPDFERITGMMQFDRYHQFTVDEHTIFAVDFLHLIEAGKLREEAPLSSELIHEIKGRTDLYVAMFLHDIAKGRGQDHSILGAEIAADLCPRLGLSAEQTETVVFLVREHLTLSDASQKRDLEDPATIRHLAETVGTVERLRLLNILTVADVMAVGPGRYTAWKAALQRHAFWHTQDLLQGKAHKEVRAERKSARLREVRRLVGDALSDEQLERYFELGHEAYWLSYRPPNLAAHAKLVANDPDALLAFDWRYDEERDLTVATVYTPGHAGVFATLAGAMALRNLSIEQGRAHTLNNGMALDTFWVRKTSGEGRLSVTDQRAAEASLRRVLETKVNISEELRRNEPAWRDRRMEVFRVPTKVVFDNKASTDQTMIEVSGHDRTGVLYRIAFEISQEGLSIQNAKIASYGTRFSDAFYVVDPLGDKITSQDRQDRLRQAIITALEPPQDAQDGSEGFELEI